LVLNKKLLILLLNLDYTESQSSSDYNQIMKLNIILDFLYSNSEWLLISLKIIN